MTTITKYISDSGKEFADPKAAAIEDHKDRVREICAELLQEWNAAHIGGNVWTPSEDYVTILRVLAETNPLEYARKLRRSFRRGMRDVATYQRDSEA